MSACLGLFAVSADAATYYFSQLYSGTPGGRNASNVPTPVYKIEANELGPIVLITGSRFRFTDGRNDPLFVDDAFYQGNNVSGFLQYTDSNGNQVSIRGTIARLTKTGARVDSFWFYAPGADGLIADSDRVAPDQGETSYLFVRLGSESKFTAGTDVPTSSDFRVSDLNDVNAEDVTVLGITGASGPEGQRLVHTVSLSTTTTATKTFNLTLTDGTALKASDYDAINLIFSNGVTFNSSTGVVTVPAGVTSFTVSIAANTDATSESSETYTLGLSNAFNSSSGIGTILDPNAANFTISKTAPATVVAGASMTYTLSIGNSGGGASGTTLVVKDRLPSGATATAATAGVGVSAVSCAGLPATGIVTCNVTLSAGIAAGSSATSASAPKFTLTVTAPASAGAITNYATVGPGGSTPTDPPSSGECLDDSCSSASTTVRSPTNLTLAKSAPAQAGVGQPLTFTLTVTNSGETTSGTSIKVLDQLPAGVLARLASAGSGVSSVSCGTLPSSAGALLECALTLSAGLAQGGTASFSITTDAPSSAGSITNYASVDPRGGPTNPPTPGPSCTGSNCANAATTISAAFPSIKVVKTATLPRGTGVGSPIEYTITVKNTGSVVVNSVTVVDTLTDTNGVALALTAGPTFSSASAGSAAGTLVPNETATYVASFTITQAALDAGGVKNSVTASGRDPQNNTATDKSDNGNPADGNDFDDDTVTNFPRLTIAKGPLGTTSQPLLAGSPTSYPITVTNVGLGASLNGATVLETIGKGLMLDSLSGQGWTCTYSNGEPLTLPAKGPLTAKCVYSATLNGGNTQAPPITATVTPLPGFLGLTLKTDASVDPSGGASPPSPGTSCAPSTACAGNANQVTPEALPTVSIAFDVPSIPSGGQTRLTVGIVNKTGTPFTALALTQALPSGISFLGNPQVITNCNGTVTTSGTNLVLSGGALAAGGTCTFSALVTSSSPSGTRLTATVTAEAIKNGQSLTNAAAASADLLIEGNFAVRKTFASSQAAVGLPVRLTLNIDNTGSAPLTEASLVDVFPAAPGRMTIASSPSVQNSCGGTITANSGTTRLSLSGGTVPAGGCAFSVLVVVDTVGDYLNVIPAGGSTGSPNGLQGKINGSPIGSVPTSQARVNADLPAAVSGVFTKRLPFGREQPVGGVTVVLKDANGNTVATAVTQPDGSYSFTNLPPTLLGDSTTKYRVEFLPPQQSLTAGLVKGKPEASNTSVNGSSVNRGIEGISALPGETTPQQNGFVVDPSGIVYNALTRQPVAGVKVTLIGPNGLPVPNSQLDLIGGTANGVPTPSNGLYLLLLNETAQTGVYRLQVEVPAGFRPATATRTSEFIPAETSTYVPQFGGLIEFIQPQQTAPTLDQNTVHYLSVRLTIGATALASSNGIAQNHLPIDPINAAGTGPIIVTKVGSQTTAELGDSVGYTVTVTNATNVPQYGVSVRDTLPVGFKYIGETGAIQRGSTTTRGDTALGIADGERVLNFRVTPASGFMRTGETITITYRVRLGVGSLRSDGINRAQATTRNGATSNEARFAVRVDGGVFADEACVIGSVYRDCNGNGVQDDGETGVAGVRVYFNDGAYMISDGNGKYSQCGRVPTTQVLKVDPSTLPAGSALVLTSNRNSGDPGSLFADLKNGEMHRADFALACPAPVAPAPAPEPKPEPAPPPPPPPPPPPAPPPVACGERVLEGVTFVTDSAEITSGGRAALEGVLQTLRGQAGLQIEVRGHTDSVASERYNQGLSERRARAVREFLIQGGLEAASLGAVGFGESKPIDTNDTDEGRARNRRVALFVTGACGGGAVDTDKVHTSGGGR